MAFVRGWLRVGVVKLSVGGGRRVASSLRSSSHLNTPAPSENHFPRAYRLTRGSELRIVREKGKRIRMQNLEIRILASLLAYPRVGFIVPKYSHTSVRRNRLKRQLREIVRLHLLNSLPRADLAVYAYPGAYDLGFVGLRKELEHVLAEILVDRCAQ